MVLKSCVKKKLPTNGHPKRWNTEIYLRIRVHLICKIKKLKYKYFSRNKISNINTIKVNVYDHTH